jgi:putative ABC transport system ATP-binding protein
VTEALISLTGVDLRLGSAANAVHVLRDVNLEISAGESVGVVGPSGSGKTTLLMVLSGLERPDTGQISVAGSMLSSMKEDAIAAFRGQNIGIVFQSFHLIPNMTALENVAVPLELAGDRRAFEKAEEELAAVGLHERLSHYPGQLSGGEQQRVAIARALAPDPKILIADEPTGNLDRTTGSHISDLLFGKQRERGMTFVLVTHDPALAAKCDRQLAVSSGRVHENVRADEAAE